MSTARRRAVNSAVQNIPEIIPAKVIKQSDVFRIVRIAREQGQPAKYTFERRHGSDGMGNEIWLDADLLTDHEGRAYLVDFVGEALERC